MDMVTFVSVPTAHGVNIKHICQGGSNFFQDGHGRVSAHGDKY